MKLKIINIDLSSLSRRKALKLERLLLENWNKIKIDVTEPAWLLRKQLNSESVIKNINDG